MRVLRLLQGRLGNTKHDHRMDRCWLKGTEGDALHAVLCAAGFNIRWLLRALAQLGLAAILLTLTALAAWLTPTIRGRHRAQLDCGAMPRH